MSSVHSIFTPNIKFHLTEKVKIIPTHSRKNNMHVSTQIPRIVGFVSAVVGLLCYALSSSFNHLFGHWNFFKIFLYFIFSFIISSTTLFPKVCQCSPSPMFETHMTILVMLATTVYSFFHDKALNEKPDAYILISCVAFAVMSLNLSKQTQCGCEVDLLNYFLGCLIILLMNIHWGLFFVGACFSYCLIILRSCFDITPQTLYPELQDHLVIQEDSQHVNIDRVIQVANTDIAIQADSQHMNTDSVIQIDSLQVNCALIMPELKTCISELEKNDRMIITNIDEYVKKYLEDYNFSKDQMVVTDYNLLIDSLPLDTINSLHETVKLMVAAGFEKECCHEYSSYRREFLQKCLQRLQLSKFNSKNSHPFFATEEWVKASKVALRILFPGERRLCDRIFFGFSSAADLSFMDICRELTKELLNFPNNLATERLFSFSYFDISLRVFTILGDLIPEFESVFSYDSSGSFKNEAISIRKRLEEAIRANFMELENHICYDMAQKAVPKAAMIDQITHHVVRCFGFVLLNRYILGQNFKYPMLGNREGTSSSLSIQVNQTMELLDSNLEAKSKYFTHPALAYVFLMNNWNYIIQRAKYSELTNILGDDWMLENITRFHQNLEHYKRTWDKVLDILKLDSNESEESMKEKLKLFNIQFKEMCSVEFGLDDQLREELRTSIGKSLLPAYGNFIGRFQNLTGKHAFEYIKYGMFDIDAQLNNFFSWK